MNRAWGALCGLALCAAGAAADDERYVALLEACYGSSARSLEAIRTEFPDFMSNTVEMLLAFARNAHENPALALLGSDSPGAVEVQGACVSADGFGMALDALRSGDPGRIESLRRSWMDAAE